MNELLTKLRFPDPIRFKEVAIVPVYVEPLAYSGERLFVGLVIESGNGIKAFPLENLNRLRCVYGPAYKSLLAARDIALSSLLAWVSRHGIGSLNDWPSPGDGIFTGALLRTTGSSVDEAVRASFSEYSSLYDEPTALMDEEPSPRDERFVGMTATRLDAAIRDIVASIKPAMANQFGQRFKVNANARPMTLGFVGQRLVANFGLIVPGVLSARVSYAKARLWDLASAREGIKAGWFGNGSAEFGLLLHHATEHDVEYSQRQLNSVKEALTELEAEADKLDLRCLPIVGAQQIANHLLRLEAEA